MQYTEPDPEQPELPLEGGDVTEGIVRKGMTVRRPLGPHSPVVHAVLRHLETIGFVGSPQFLGLDAQRREVLSFIEGEVAGRPYPEWVADEQRAASVARLVRALDDAMLRLGLPPNLIPPEYDLPDAPPAIGPPASFLGHRDITPENVVFRQNQAYALIDFDLLKPSSRLDEVCNLLRWWAPLTPVADREPVMRDLNAFARVERLINEYGLDAASREQFVSVALRTAERGWHSMRIRAERDGGGWQRMWNEGAGDGIIRRCTWLKENAESLHRAATTLSSAS